MKVTFGYGARAAIYAAILPLWLATIVLIPSRTTYGDVVGWMVEEYESDRYSLENLKEKSKFLAQLCGEDAIVKHVGSASTAEEAKSIIVPAAKECLGRLRRGDQIVSFGILAGYLLPALLLIFLAVRNWLSWRRQKKSESVPL